MPHYVIAPRRDAPSIPPDWQERLARIPGVGVTGTAGNRVQFEAEAGTVDEVRRRLGTEFRVEAAVIRQAIDTESGPPPDRMPPSHPS